MISKASAPGKVILFGEHFVVYGEKAILGSIDKRILVTSETNEEKDRFFFREPNDFATIMLDAEYIDLRNSTQIDWSNKPSEGFE